MSIQTSESTKPAVKRNNDSPTVEPGAERHTGFERRRASDEPYQLYRRYIVLGSWIGHVLFLVNGGFLAFSYGGFGGIQFFSHMWLLDKAGGYAALFGVVAGIFIAVLCVWAMGVIACAFLASLVYWLKYRSIPLAVEEQ